MSIVTAINQRLVASSTIGAVERLTSLKAEMQGRPEFKRTVEEIGFTETLVLAAQRGDGISVPDIDEALRKAGVTGQRALRFKVDLTSCLRALGNR